MIIETENLSKRFGRHEAVHEMNLTVPKGAAMALIGANGAGKTTTIRLLMNLLSPDSGSARVLGVDSRRLSHRELARIGYVSENQRMPERLTVEDFFDYLRPLYPTWDPDLERSIRRQLEVPPKTKIGALSHGQRMKTALAAALPFRPELLVLDEPLSGLDPLMRDEVLGGLLTQAGETTVLISSHELTEMEGAATHAAFIDSGVLVFQEAMEDVRARFREVHVVVGVGVNVPDRTPENWLRPEVYGNILTFVHTAFSDDAALAADVRCVVGDYKAIEAHPMSLRGLSKALMRAARAPVH